MIIALLKVIQLLIEGCMHLNDPVLNYSTINHVHVRRVTLRWELLCKIHYEFNMATEI